MNELIKIAGNGQWTLEKAKTDEEKLKLIEQFIADKKAKAAQAQSKPAAPKAHPLERLRPVNHLTGDNPDLTREQVAEKRSRLTSAEQAAEADAKRRRDALAANNRPVTGITPSVKPQASAPAAAVNPDNDAGLAQDIEANQRAQGRKAAWQATTEFLANHGSRGMRAVAEAGQTRNALQEQQTNIDKGIKPAVAPKVKQELQPPHEPFTDEKTGAPGTRIKQGTFHNQGATTTGKIVDTNHFFKEKDPTTGEEKMHRVVRPQVQKHHWAWDHNEKKWNHLRTTLANPELGKS